MLGGAEVGLLALSEARSSLPSMKLWLLLEELREIVGRLSLFGLSRLLSGEGSESERLTQESFPLSLLRVMPGVVGVVGIEASIPSERVLLCAPSILVKPPHSLISNTTSLVP